jgi:hypothetical protein
MPTCQRHGCTCDLRLAMNAMRPLTHMRPLSPACCFVMAGLGLRRERASKFWLRAWEVVLLDAIGVHGKSLLECIAVLVCLCGCTWYVIVLRFESGNSACRLCAWLGCALLLRCFSSLRFRRWQCALSEQESKCIRSSWITS